MTEGSSRLTRARLKNHSRNLHAPLCGIFSPNSVAVDRMGKNISTCIPDLRYILPEFGLQLRVPHPGKMSHKLLQKAFFKYVLGKSHYTGIFATKQYITIKWQALPSIINTWKISCDPKFLCLALKMGSFSA